MTTRHVSAENVYPFVPDAVSPEEAIGGIKDIYFVFEGESTTSKTAPAEGVYLDEYEVIGDDTLFTFVALFGDRKWECQFLVPHSGGTGQVEDISAGVRAVLVFDTDEIIKTGAGFVDNAQVEPSRAQFYPELISLIRFKNIYRCSGAENPDDLELVYSYSPGGVLAFADGYNCVVSYSEETGLSFFGSPEAGLGAMPGYGDNCSASSSAASDSSDEGITTVNGNTPVGGDIAVTVSPKLGKQVSVGRIVISAQVFEASTQSSVGG